MDQGKRACLIEWVNCLIQEDKIISLKSLKDGDILIKIVEFVDNSINLQECKSPDQCFESILGFLEGFYHSSLSKAINILSIKEKSEELEIGKICMLLLNAVLQCENAGPLVAKVMELDHKIQFEIKDIMESLLCDHDLHPRNLARILCNKLDLFSSPCSDIRSNFHKNVKMTMADSPRTSELFSNSPAYMSPIKVLFQSPHMAQKIALRQKEQEIKKLERALNSECHLRSDLEFEVLDKNKQLDEKDTKIRNLERTVIDLRRLQDELDILQFNKSECERLDKEVNRLKSKLLESETVRSQCILLEKENKGLYEDIRQLQEQTKKIEPLLSHLESSKVQVKRLELQITELTESLGRKQEELNNLTILRDLSVRQSQQMQQLLEEKSALLEDQFCREVAMSPSGECLSLVTEKQLQESEEETQQLRIELAKLHSELLETQQSLTVLQASFCSTKSELLSAKDETRLLASQLDNSNNQIDILRQEKLQAMQQMQTTIKDLELSISHQNDNLKMLNFQKNEIETSLSAKLAESLADLCLNKQELEATILSRQNITSCLEDAVLKNKQLEQNIENIKVESILKISSLEELLNNIKDEMKMKEDYFKLEKESFSRNLNLSQTQLMNTSENLHQLENQNQILTKSLEDCVRAKKELEECEKSTLSKVCKLNLAILNKKTTNDSENDLHIELNTLSASILSMKEELVISKENVQQAVQLRQNLLYSLSDSESYIKTLTELHEKDKESSNNCIQKLNQEINHLQQLIQEKEKEFKSVDEKLNMELKAEKQNSLEKMTYLEKQLEILKENYDVYRVESEKKFNSLAQEVKEEKKSLNEKLNTLEVNLFDAQTKEAKMRSTITQLNEDAKNERDVSASNTFQLQKQLDRLNELREIDIKKNNDLLEKLRVDSETSYNKEKKFQSTIEQLLKDSEHDKHFLNEKLKDIEQLNIEEEKLKTELITLSSLKKGLEIQLENERWTRDAAVQALKEELLDIKKDAQEAEEAIVQEMTIKIAETKKSFEKVVCEKKEKIDILNKEKQELLVNLEESKKKILQELDSNAKKLQDKDNQITSLGEKLAFMEEEFRKEILKKEDTIKIIRAEKEEAEETLNKMINEKNVQLDTIQNEKQELLTNLAEVKESLQQEFNIHATELQGKGNQIIELMNKLSSSEEELKIEMMKKEDIIKVITAEKKEADEAWSVQLDTIQNEKQELLNSLAEFKERLQDKDNEKRELMNKFSSSEEKLKIEIVKKEDTIKIIRAEKEEAEETLKKVISEKTSQLDTIKNEKQKLLTSLSKHKETIRQQFNIHAKELQDNDNQMRELMEKLSCTEELKIEIEKKEDMIKIIRAEMEKVEKTLKMVISENIAQLNKIQNEKQELLTSLAESKESLQEQFNMHTKELQDKDNYIRELIDKLASSEEEFKIEILKKQDILKVVNFEKEEIGGKLEKVIYEKNIEIERLQSEKQELFDNLAEAIENLKQECNVHMKEVEDKESQLKNLRHKSSLSNEEFKIEILKKEDIIKALIQEKEKIKQNLLEIEEKSMQISKLVTVKDNNLDVMLKEKEELLNNMRSKENAYKKESDNLLNTISRIEKQKESDQQMIKTFQKELSNLELLITEKNSALNVTIEEKQNLILEWENTQMNFKKEMEAIKLDFECSVAELNKITKHNEILESDLKVERLNLEKLKENFTKSQDELEQTSQINLGLNFQIDSLNLKHNQEMEILRMCLQEMENSKENQAEQLLQAKLDLEQKNAELIKLTIDGEKIASELHLIKLNHNTSISQFIESQKLLQQSNQIQSELKLQIEEILDTHDQEIQMLKTKLQEETNSKNNVENSEENLKQKLKLMQTNYDDDSYKWKKEVEDKNSTIQLYYDKIQNLESELLTHKLELEKVCNKLSVIKNKLIEERDNMEEEMKISTNKLLELITDKEMVKQNLRSMMGDFLLKMDRLNLALAGNNLLVSFSQNENINPEWALETDDKRISEKNCEVENPSNTFFEKETLDKRNELHIKFDKLTCIAQELHTKLYDNEEELNQKNKNILELENNIDCQLETFQVKLQDYSAQCNEEKSEKEALQKDLKESKNSFEKELEHLRSQLKDCHVVIEQLHQEKETVITQLNLVKRSFDEHQIKQKDLSKTCSNLELQMKSLEKEKEQLEDLLQKNKERHEKEKNELETKTQSLEKKHEIILKEIMSKNETLQSHLAVLEMAKVELMANEKLLGKENTQLNEQIENLQKNIVTSEKEIAEKRLTIKKHLAEEKELLIASGILKQKMEKLEKDLNDLIKKNTLLQEEKEEQKILIAKHRDNSERHENQKLESQARLEVLEQENTVIKPQLELATKELLQFRKRIQQLDETLENKEKIIESTQKIIEEKSAKVQVLTDDVQAQKSKECQLQEVLNSTIDEFNLKLTLKDNKVKSLGNELNHLYKELNNLNSQILLLTENNEQLNKKFESENTDLRSNLRDKNSCIEKLTLENSELLEKNVENETKLGKLRLKKAEMRKKMKDLELDCTGRLNEKENICICFKSQNEDLLMKLSSSQTEVLELNQMIDEFQHTLNEKCNDYEKQIENLMQENANLCKVLDHQQCLLRKINELNFEMDVLQEKSNHVLLNAEDKAISIQKEINEIMTGNDMEIRESTNEVAKVLGKLQDMDIRLNKKKIEFSNLLQECEQGRLKIEDLKILLSEGKSANSTLVEQLSSERSAMQKTMSQSRHELEQAKRDLADVEVEMTNLTQCHAKQIADMTEQLKLVKDEMEQMYKDIENAQEQRKLNFQEHKNQVLKLQLERTENDCKYQKDRTNWQHEMTSMKQSLKLLDHQVQSTFQDSEKVQTALTHKNEMLDQQLSTMQQKLESFSFQLEQSRAQEKEKDNRNSELEKQNKELLFLLTEQKKKIDPINNENKNLKKENNILKKQNDSKKIENLSQFQELKKNLERLQLQQTESDLHKKESLRSHAIREVELQKDISCLKLKLEKATEKCDQLEKLLKSQEAAHKELSELNDKLRLNYETKKEELTEVNSEVDKTKKTVLFLEGKIELLEAELIAVKQKNLHDKQIHKNETIISETPVSRHTQGVPVTPSEMTPVSSLVENGSNNLNHYNLRKRSSPEPELKSKRSRFSSLASEFENIKLAEERVPDKQFSSSLANSYNFRRSVPAGAGILFSCEDEPLEFDWDRITELQRRNTLCLPHQKSAYPVETQTRDLKEFSEESLRKGLSSAKAKAATASLQLRKRQQFELEKHISNSSEIQIGRRKMKAQGLTTYQKPGPPTPAKNFQAKATRSFKTPNSLRKLFGVTRKYTIENDDLASSQENNVRQSLAFEIGFTPKDSKKRRKSSLRSHIMNTVKKANPQTPLRQPLKTKNFSTMNF